MKPHPYLTLLLIIFVSSCQHADNSAEKVKTRLNFQVYPEDYERKLYTVEWTDTLGQKEGYVADKWLKRPKEIWCVVTNTKQDTLAYYTGLSMARHFVSFEATDSFITLNFMIGLNFFSDKFDTQQGAKEFSNGIEAYTKDNKLPIMFEPIVINLNTDLRKKYDVELIEK